MKWFTACNQSSLEDDQFFNLLKVAVLSADRNTSLVPYLIYDGTTCDQLDWLCDHGVTVLRKSLSFFEPLRDYVLKNFDEELLRIRSGAFLRTELPVTLNDYGICDPYVLYTDADVVFSQEIQLENRKPRYFAACARKYGGRTRFHLGGDYYFNSGVMVMNVEALRSEYPQFVEFVVNNAVGLKRPQHPLLQKNLFLSDQAALNLYFNGRIDRLPDVYNWAPFKGYNPAAKVVHFHGLKWTQWEDFSANRMRQDRQDKFTRLIARHREDFYDYVRWASGFLSDQPEARESQRN